MGFWETAFFYMFALGALVSSFAVIVYRNPLYSAIALVLDFLFFAGLYVLLSAHFMAIIQVLVYAGAIMVLFVFIIMLLNLRDEDLGEFQFKVHHLLAAVTGLAILGFAGSAIAPLVDEAAVEEARNEAITAAENTEVAEGEEKPRPMVATKTAVPGLYADLSEKALQDDYAAQIDDWDSGASKPSDGKYRPYDAARPVVVPDVLKAEGETTPAGPDYQKASWGTVEPMSILLVNRFVVPFELAALLLLAAIVGAVIIAKKRL